MFNKGGYVAYVAVIIILLRIAKKCKLGLYISCSATFEQLFRFGATFSPSSTFSDFEQLFFFFFLNNFLGFKAICN